MPTWRATRRAGSWRSISTCSASGTAIRSGRTAAGWRRTWSGRTRRPAGRSAGAARADGRSERGRLALEEDGQVGGRELQADEERAELGVVGARLVETHLVNQLLEDHRVVGEQIDAPLPVVETDRAGDDLGHLRPVG